MLRNASATECQPECQSGPTQGAHTVTQAEPLRNWPLTFGYTEARRYQAAAAKAARFGFCSEIRPAFLEPCFCARFH